MSLFPHRGKEPVINHHPSLDITKALDSVRSQASISLPPGAKVERLLPMTTPSPSPPISLSPPSAGERLARCMALPAHSSPPPVPSPLLPSPRDDVLESKQPPRKRSCLFALGSRYEVGESFIARPTRGQGVDYGFISTETVWMVEEEAYASQEAWAPSIELSQATHQELQTYRDHVYAHETHIQAHQTQLQLLGTLIQTQHHVYETCFQMQQAEIAALQESDRRRQTHIAETLYVIRDMRREMSDI
ncbi:hypothetical protein Tco_0120944 [Tanacetum coccineum]